MHISGKSVAATRTQRQIHAFLAAALIGAAGSAVGADPMSDTFQPDAFRTRAALKERTPGLEDPYTRDCPSPATPLRSSPPWISRCAATPPRAPPGPPRISRRRRSAAPRAHGRPPLARRMRRAVRTARTSMPPVPALTTARTLTMPRSISAGPSTISAAAAGALPVRVTCWMRPLRPPIAACKRRSSMPCRAFTALAPRTPHYRRPQRRGRGGSQRGNHQGAS